MGAMTDEHGFTNTVVRTVKETQEEVMLCEMGSKCLCVVNIGFQKLEERSFNSELLFGELFGDCFQ